VALFQGVNLKRVSWTGIIVALLLLLIGLAFVHSASYRSEGPEGYYTSSSKKQVVWAAMGFLVFLAVIAVDYRRLVEWGYCIYVVGLALLILTMFIGVTIKGSTRWIDFGPLRLQTSEFMKIAGIMALARYLARWESRGELRGFIAPVLLTFIPIVIIAKQPDLGTSMMLLPMAAGMVYVAGAKRKYLIILGVSGLLALPGMWLVMKPYQKQRVITFINQDSSDPEMLMDELYHLTQSKAAIGSGGLLGKGWQRGTQNRSNFLPMRNTDFIFAVIAEEWGLAGSAAVLVLYFLLFLSCSRVADRTRDPPGRLLVTGVIVLLATQVLINTAMTAGQFPTVGLPLPFISYGGSSLLASFVCLGLVVNVSMRPTIIWGREGEQWREE